MASVKPFGMLDTVDGKREVPRLLTCLRVCTF